MTGSEVVFIFFLILFCISLCVTGLSKFQDLPLLILAQVLISLGGKTTVLQAYSAQPPRPGPQTKIWRPQVTRKECSLPTPPHVTQGLEGVGWVWSKASLAWVSFCEWEKGVAAGPAPTGPLAACPGAGTAPATPMWSRACLDPLANTIGISAHPKTFFVSNGDFHTEVTLGLPAGECLRGHCKGELRT